jgi:hypothetical protein
MSSAKDNDVITTPTFFLLSLSLFLCPKCLCVESTKDQLFISKLAVTGVVKTMSDTDTSIGPNK